MSGVNSTIFLFLVLGLLCLVMVLYAVVILIGRLRRRKAVPPDTQVGFVVETFHDLVARLKEKEKELEENRNMAEERAGRIEDYNEYILQSVPSGVVGMDGSCKVVKVNSSAERILEVKAGDLIGRDGAGVFPGEFLRHAHRRGESRYTTSSGKNLWLGYTLTPLLDESGNTIGQLLVFTDLTELRALESQAELRRRLSSLGEMAAGVAHELRNPMGVISGYMRLLDRKVDGSLKDVVDAVSTEVSVMDRIINDFLHFARPGELQLSDVDVCGLVKSCVEAFPSADKEVGISVEVEGTVSVRADEVLLRQAITNLLRNSLDATPSGGGISVACRSGSDGAEISVSDTGHGIPDGIRDRVFLPFYTTKEMGTGLGLAIVHRIITDHGGGIDIKSPEKGTTITITLPFGSP
jgi:signal transduction histidine kinase